MSPARQLAVFARAGLLSPPRPDKAVGMVAALGLWGVSPAGGYAAHAARRPSAPAVIDAAGSLSFADVDRLTTAMANGLGDRGLGPGDRVGLLCGNSRWFVLGLLALGKAGVTAVLLNTSFAPPQLADALDTERATAAVYEPALGPLLAATGIPRIAAESLDGDARPRPPAEPGGFVVLTSGTVGWQKGPARGTPRSLDVAVGLLGAIPFHADEVVAVAAPLFHGWGLAGWLLNGALLGSTVVPYQSGGLVDTLERTGATTLVTVPTVLRRLLDDPRTPDLRVVAVSGSALPPDLATRFLDRYGDVLYDLYGSTEVGWASVAGPADLRAAPGTVGRPPAGVTVEVRDGRILVGGDLALDDGLMATGDLGRIDAEGRLFVAGRADDMVVSGGENVFPGEVEDVIAALPGVVEVAVVGVPDEEYGQRLRAVVVADGRVTADAVRDHVRNRLARYKVPRDVVFVDVLPRNASGKVLRRDL